MSLPINSKSNDNIKSGPFSSQKNLKIDKASQSQSPRDKETHEVARKVKFKESAEEIIIDEGKIAKNVIQLQTSEDSSEIEDFNFLKNFAVEKTPKDSSTKL